MQNLTIGTSVRDFMALLQSRAESDIICYRFYVACVGFGVPNYSDEAILKKMNCGKCHDYAAITLYSLSCHKFLTYSAMVEELVLICHGLLFLFLNCLGFQCTPSHLNKTCLWISIFIDSLHMLITAIDILNIVDERLEDYTSYVSDFFNYRSKWMDVLKLFLQFILVWLWLSLVSSTVQLYSYYLYLVVCFLIETIVSGIVDSGTKVPSHPISSKKE